MYNSKHSVETSFTGREALLVSALLGGRWDSLYMSSTVLSLGVLRNIL